MEKEKLISRIKKYAGIGVVTVSAALIAIKGINMVADSCRKYDNTIDTKYTYEIDNSVNKKDDGLEKTVEDEVVSKEVNSVDARWILQRAVYSEKSTLGNLYDDVNFNGEIDEGDELLCNTLELPDRNNKPFISSIPEGEYSVKVRRRGASSKIPYEHLKVNGVPDRSGILFHLGNTPEDIEGCILPGRVTDEKDHVADSGIALNKILEIANKEENLMLKIVDTQ